MVIRLGAELEAALMASARRRGVDPEALALDVLRERFLPADSAINPQDDWERRLLGVATDCGVSLPHSALSSDGLCE